MVTRLPLLVWLLLGLGLVVLPALAQEASLRVTAEVVSACRDGTSGRPADQDGACRPMVAPALAPEPYVLSPELDRLRRQVSGATEEAPALPLVTVIY
jgi:hypothetical protein